MKDVYIIILVSFIIKDNFDGFMDYDPDVEFPPVDDESSDDMNDSSYDGDSEMSF